MGDKKALAQLIVNHLKGECSSGGLNEDAVESLEVSIQCLEQAYGLEDPLPALPGACSLMDMYGKACAPKPIDKLQAEKYKGEGNNFMKAEQFQEAVNQYTLAMESDNTNAVYYCNRAAAYTSLQDFKKAIADCEQAIIIDPNYGKAYGRMGLACINDKAYDKAVQSYEKALQLEPNNVTYSQNLDLAKERLKQAETTGTPAGGTPGGPNLGGLDLSSLLSNPAVMNMAASFMQNPQMQNMFANMMGGMTQAPDQQQQAVNPETPTNPGTTTPAQSQEAREFEQQTGASLPPGMDLGGIMGATQQFAEQMRNSNPELVEQLRQQFSSSGAAPDTDTPAPDETPK